MGEILNFEVISLPLWAHISMLINILGLSCRRCRSREGALQDYLRRTRPNLQRTVGLLNCLHFPLLSSSCAGFSTYRLSSVQKLACLFKDADFFLLTLPLFMFYFSYMYFAHTIALSTFVLPLVRVRCLFIEQLHVCAPSVSMLPLTILELHKLG